jgi:hypothetical protein
MYSLIIFIVQFSESEGGMLSLTPIAIFNLLNPTGWLRCCF